MSVYPKFQFVGLIVLPPFVQSFPSGFPVPFPAICFLTQVLFEQSILLHGIVVVICLFDLEGH